MTRFNAVLDFIEEVLDDDVSIADLASMAGLSVSRFAHAFKAAHGVAPYRYILQRRIERAMVLLRTGNETIAMTAAQVGFSSESHFGQMFARTVGTTPSAYRSAVANAWPL
jgi:AraC family transcriptional regulator